MTHLLLTLQNEEDEKEMASFLSLHPNVLAVKQESEVDEDGNFKWIDLSKPGLPLSKSYMDWRIEDARKQIANGKFESQAEFESWYFSVKEKQAK